MKPIRYYPPSPSSLSSRSPSTSLLLLLILPILTIILTYSSQLVHATSSPSLFSPTHSLDDHTLIKWKLPTALDNNNNQVQMKIVVLHGNNKKPIPLLALAIAEFDGLDDPLGESRTGVGAVVDVQAKTINQELTWDEYVGVNDASSSGQSPAICLLDKCGVQVTKCESSVSCAKALVCLRGINATELASAAKEMNNTVPGTSSDPVTNKIFQCVQTLQRAGGGDAPMDAFLGVVGCSLTDCITSLRTATRTVTGPPVATTLLSCITSTTNTTYEVILTWPPALVSRASTKIYVDQPIPTTVLVSASEYTLPTPFADTTAAGGHVKPPFLFVNLRTGEAHIKGSTPAWLIAHAVFCVLGISLFVPVGAWIRHSRREVSYALLALSMIFFLIGLLTATMSARRHISHVKPNEVSHEVAGLFTLALLLASQIIVALRYDSPFDSIAARISKRANTSRIVVILEFCTLVFAFCATYLGSLSYPYIDFDAGGLLFLVVISGLALCLYVVATVSWFGVIPLVKRKAMAWATMTPPVAARMLTPSDAMGLTMGLSQVRISPVDLLFCGISHQVIIKDTNTTAPEAASGLRGQALIQPGSNSSSSINNPNKSESIKTVLIDACGELPSSSLTSIIGPSGAGKSTLLEILAGRLKPTSGLLGRAGIRFLDPREKEPGTCKPRAGFSINVGFVAQADRLHEHLTPFETLMFVVAISSPERTHALTVHRVQTLLADLGLDSVKDVSVGGGQAVRGLSGGERRRVAIAIQLINSPSILLCDEPTSGLDSASAYRIVSLLSRLSKEKRCVVCSIHQPSSQVFELFDRVVLLSRGRTIYSGPRDRALDWFKNTLGKPMPAMSSAPEFFLSVMENEDDAQLEIFAKIFQSNSSFSMQELMDACPMELALGKQQQRHHYLNTTATTTTAGTSAAPPLAAPHPTIFVQVALLTKRALLLVARDPHALRMLVFQNVLFSILIGSVFSELGAYQLGAVSKNNAIGMLLAFCAYSSTALGLWMGYADRLSTDRERQDGLYSDIAYFISRTFFCIGVDFALILLVSVLPYFWLNLRADGSSFVFYLLSATAVIFAFDSVSFIVSLRYTDINEAYGATNVFMAIAIFFSSTVVPFRALPIYWKWAYFVAPFSYSFGGEMLNEFEGGEDEWWLLLMGLPMRGYNKWLSLAVAFGMGIVYRLVCFMYLRRIWTSSSGFNNVSAGAVGGHDNGSLYRRPTHARMDNGGQRNHTNDLVQPLGGVTSTTVAAGNMYVGGDVEV